MRRKVNWVLDADIRDYFSCLDWSWLERFLEHRIADRRVLRLIQKWLRAGVIEDGGWLETVEGTAAGASASPLLANVYLHYVFDLWAHQWRGRRARGEVIIVRFADDYIVGFERRDDAERFQADLRRRLARFGLELASEKTRLIEFGRFAAERRRARGLGKPETFEFLGFTHICGKRRTTGMREGNERVLHRRSSESRWPRVMRWRSARAQRSVHRGARGPAIAASNCVRSGCRRVGTTDSFGPTATA